MNSNEAYLKIYDFLDNLEAPYYNARREMPYLPFAGWQHMPMRVAVFDQICPDETL